jgi:hypothetical protein
MDPSEIISEYASNIPNAYMNPNAIRKKALEKLVI